MGNSSREKTRGQAEYFWQEEENQTLLATIRDQDQKKRKRRSGQSKIEKDGITLVRDSALSVDAEPASAQDFFAQELFGRRKRTRTMADRHDRAKQGVNIGTARVFNNPAKGKP